MKLVLITLDINEVGGVGRVISSLTNYFVDKFGYHIEIISIFKPERNERYFKFNEKIKFKYLNIDNSKNSKIDKIRKYKEMIQVLKVELSNKEYDIVMTFNTMVSLCICANYKNLKGKFIATEHGEYYHFGKGWRLLRRLMYRHTDNLVVLTNQDKIIYKKFLKNVISIPNPIPFKSSNVANLESKSIVSVGRLEEDKGFIYTIEAFAEIVEHRPDWTLNIVGDGSKKEELLSKVYELGIQNNVFIHPFSKDIQNEYMKHSIYTLTSKTEAFPMVLLEAMECGIPCVSFDIAGPKEIIKDNEDGFIVKQYDKGELKEKLLKLINDDNLRYEFSRNSRKNIQRYSIENICESWKNIFESK